MSLDGAPGTVGRDRKRHGLGGHVLPRPETGRKPAAAFLQAGSRLPGKPCQGRRRGPLAAQPPPGVPAPAGRQAGGDPGRDRAGHAERHAADRTPGLRRAVPARAAALSARPVPAALSTRAAPAFARPSPAASTDLNPSPLPATGFPGRRLSIGAFLSFRSVPEPLAFFRNAPPHRPVRARLHPETEKTRPARRIFAESAGSGAGAGYCPAENDALQRAGKTVFRHTEIAPSAGRADPQLRLRRFTGKFFKLRSNPASKQVFDGKRR